MTDTYTFNDFVPTITAIIGTHAGHGVLSKVVSTDVNSDDSTFTSHFINDPSRKNSPAVQFRNYRDFGSVVIQPSYVDIASVPVNVGSNMIIDFDSGAFSELDDGSWLVFKFGDIEDYHDAVALVEYILDEFYMGL